MPFDQNGIALVSGNRPVNGQGTDAAQINVPLADIQSMLSQLLLKSGVAPMQGNLNMNGFSIAGLQDPSNSGDPVTLSYLNNIIAQSGVPTGAVQGFRMKTAPSGWVKENGGTIGNAASGATTRANADTLNLFTNQWNNFDNTERPIQTSAGAATTRGASAAADFAANKRFPLADSRSRFMRGADDGLGFDASLIVGVSQDDAIKSHTHTGTTGVSGGHVHNATVSSGSGGSRITGGASNPIGTDTQGIQPSGDHQHSFTTDATGVPLETRPRSSVLLYCIKL